MDLSKLLHEHMNEILTEAENSLSRAHLTHYEKAG